MNLQEIEKLIEKYYEGETSLAEEKLLRDYFTSGEVPGHWKTYQEYFRFIDEEKQKNLSDATFDDRCMELIEKETKKTPLFDLRRPWIYWVAGVAATALILIAVFVKFDPLPGRIADTYDDPETAYVEARKILLYVSSKLDQGTSRLEPVNVMDKGLSELQPITAYDKAAGQVKRLGEVEKISKMINRN